MAIILVVFVVNRFMGNRGTERQNSNDEQQDEGSQMPFDLEQLFGTGAPREVEEPKVKEEPTFKSQYVEMKTDDPIVEGEITEKKESKSVEFDLRKAVIMTEILTPKFKNE
ncbi:MAG: hypothetical protein SNI18_00290 [Rikenellaceae bacterium]